MLGAPVRKKLVLASYTDAALSYSRSTYGAFDPIIRRVRLSVKYEIGRELRKAMISNNEP